MLCMEMVDKSFIYLGDERTWIEIGQWVLLPKITKMEIHQTQNNNIKQITSCTYLNFRLFNCSVSI